MPVPMPFSAAAAGSSRMGSSRGEIADSVVSSTVVATADSAVSR